MRFIEVKGRAGVGEVALSSNEYKTAERLKNDYWLYVVFNCATKPEVHVIQDPIRVGWEPVQRVEHYHASAARLLSASLEDLSMPSIDYDHQVYHLAQEFLLSVEPITPELLDKYLSFSTTHPRPDSLNGIYFHILESSQNAGMGPTVIGKAVGGLERLAKVLHDFDPEAVQRQYGDDTDRLLDTVEKKLRPAGKIRRTPRSLWPRFCRACLSAARFLSQFRSATDFYQWVDFFDNDSRARPALPMLLAQEIEGIGFALACDFLKELGYVNFAKPDVHLRRLFTTLDLCPPKASDYQVFNAIVRMAENVNATPYHVDKLFWLIGSGNFYDDDLKIGRQSDRFIKYARKHLRSASG